MKRPLLLLVLLFAVGCSGEPVQHQKPHAAATAPVEAPTKAVKQVTKAEACATVQATLSRLQTPLQLLADGGTPVSWSDDFRDAAKTFHNVGKTGPGTVAYYADGLGGDLDRLVTALDHQRTGTVKAVGEVVTNRIRNLKNSCTKA